MTAPDIAGWILIVLEAYAWIGGAVALVFLTIGIDRIEPSARGAAMFRPLVAPGIVLLWPLVLLRWRALARRQAGR